MRPTYIRDGNLLYSFYQSNVNFIWKHTHRHMQNNVCPNTGVPHSPAKLQTASFPSLITPIQDFTGIHGQSDKDVCTVAWTSEEPFTCSGPQSWKSSMSPGKWAGAVFLSVVYVAPEPKEIYQALCILLCGKGCKTFTLERYNGTL